jgi:phosphatidylserine/phosphatidylglycerophosphate/cardiolipin synthase-like enzyme
LYYSKYTISKIAKQNLIKNANKYFKIHKENKNNIMQLSCSSPINNEKNITSILVSLFVNAKKTIKIVTPYFFLTNELLTALLDVV